MRDRDGPFFKPLDRARPLAEQLHERLRAAIESGQLQRGARLPSWRDLAAQLGVSRGTVREAYERLGLNARQIETIARAVPKRDYWFQSAAGCRLFELGLGPVALAFCGASRAEDLATIDRIIRERGRNNFASAWLRERGLHWAAELIGERT